MARPDTMVRRETRGGQEVVFGKVVFVPVMTAVARCPLVLPAAVGPSCLAYPIPLLATDRTAAYAKLCLAKRHSCASNPMKRQISIPPPATLQILRVYRQSPQVAGGGIGICSIPPPAMLSGKPLFADFTAQVAGGGFHITDEAAHGSPAQGAAAHGISM